MQKTTQTILKENEKRKKELFPEYDPFLGIGSPIERVPFKITDDFIINIPKQMANVEEIKEAIELGSLEKFAIKHGAKLDEETIPAFNDVRRKYDFEFWTSENVWIRAKTQEGEDASTIVKFVLNRAQRKFLKTLEDLRLAGKPIRIILLKARQWGGSTLVEMYIAWLQLYWVPEYNSLIVADVQAQARHILGMYDFMATHHTPPIELIPYQRTQNYRMIRGQVNIIGVASVERPESPRSFTWQMLHLTELGSWKSTQKVNAENLAASLEGGLVDSPYTLSVKESTAQGVGNFFHREWLRAEQKKSNDIPIFVSWIEQQDTVLTWSEIKSDKDTFPNVNSLDDFVESWNDYEKWLWSQNATIEQIAWYRKKARSYPSQTKMWQEHPTTAKEAFESTGARVFSRERVAYARSTCMEPIAIGSIIGKSHKGREALIGIKFVPHPAGPLKIWTNPGEAGIEKSEKRYTNRYAAFADSGGKRDTADWSVLTILDRIWTLFGGVPTVAAEFRSHLDPDLFAWQCVQICKWYENALFAIEMNKMESAKYGNDDVEEPEYGLTVMDEIKNHYSNLFYRVRPETVKEHWNGVLGFWTSTSTKQLIINSLDAALRDQEYEERNLLVCEELDIYEYKQGGKMGNVEGGHDDTVISRAGVVWLSNQMPPVEEVDAIQKPAKKKKGDFANFA
jgi:hypothetical protein